jgi:hypothetical protein
MVSKVKLEGQETRNQKQGTSSQNVSIFIIVK